MAIPHIWEITHTEGETLPLRARVVNHLGVRYIAADVSAVSVNIYDLDGATPSTAIATVSPSVASIVEATDVVNDGSWTADNIGYNCSHDIAFSTTNNSPAGSVNWVAGKTYRVVLTVGTTTDGNKFVGWNVACKGMTP